MIIEDLLCYLCNPLNQNPKKLVGPPFGKGRVFSSPSKKMLSVRAYVRLTKKRLNKRTKVSPFFSHTFALQPFLFKAIRQTIL